MKKLAIFCGIALVLALMSGHAYAQSFGFDIDGDGQIDDPCETTISTGETIQIDIYLNWPTENPNLAGLDYAFSWDSTKMSFVSVTWPGDPWDEHGEFPSRNYYGLSLLETSTGVPGLDPILLHTVTLHCEAPGDGWVKATPEYVIGADDNEYTGVDDAYCTIHQLGLGCVRDEDCDDGLFCNGEETCEGETCQPGTDPCPGEACNEDKYSCESTPATTTITNTSPDISMTAVPQTGIPSTPDSTESISTITITTPIALNTTTITEQTTKTQESPERIAEISSKTTTIPLSSPYRVFVSPSSVMLNSGGGVEFSAYTISDGKEARGEYLWKIVPASSIGSTIDKNGQFTAGKNTSDSNIRETVRAIDTIHENTYGAVMITIEVKKQPTVGCELSISPSSVDLFPGDTITFFAKNLGERCREGSFKWKIFSKIDSQISANGLYTAGKNKSGNSAIDIIIVKDSANGKSADAIATVLSSGKVTQATSDATQKPQQEILSLKISIAIIILIILTSIVLFWRIKR